MSKQLFDDSDDNLSEKDYQIKTNESYAKTYNILRKKELLQKFKDKGLDATESESEGTDSSEEDEILDPTFDQEFLRALASLKGKDPSIYDKNIKFFRNEESTEVSEGNLHCNVKKEKRSKPITLKDYERKIILEKGGKFVDDLELGFHGKQRLQPPSPTLVEEERSLRDEFKKIMNQDDDNGDEEFGGFLKIREKSKADEEREEEDYLKWLAGKKESIEGDIKEKLNPLKNYWSNDKLPSSEKFLRDYVLNKGYIEATNYNEIPTYEEVTGDHSALLEDEQELEKQAEFEHKYNFRYEEADQEFIKRYPRTIKSSLRVTDEKRKKKRQAIKERKLQEKQQKLKEMEMIKEIKRKEIQQKIEKLKMVTGNEELGFKDDDLEDDFDPDSHDRRMRELFNDDYYQIDEGEEKPECPSDIEELKIEDWDNYDPQQEDVVCDYTDNEPHCEDEDFNMDCDYDPANAKEDLQKELIENTRKRKGGRKGRRDRFKEIIKSKKPFFDPEDEKTYGEYIDEYYKLDCEDIIGDMPCRFKYVETTPNDFGLTIEEILLAKNKELNQWASLKKAIQIRPSHIEKKEQRLYKLKSKNEELKRKIFKSLYGEEGSDNENEDMEMKKSKEDYISLQTALNDKNSNENTMQGESKKAKKRRKRKVQNSEECSIMTVGNETSKNSSICRENENVVGVISTKKAKIQLKTSSDNNRPTESKKGLDENEKNNRQNQNELQTAATNERPSDSANEKFHLTKNIKRKASNLLVDSKLVARNNPFSRSAARDTCKKENAELSTSLGKHLSPLKKLDVGAKFNSKLKNQKRFNGKLSSKDISDERLRAYGINPRKFHKKQKHQNAKKKSLKLH